jgi:hypothetical protein
MRFLPVIFFTSETSCPAGIFWWTPVQHTQFSSPVFGSTFWTCSHRSWRPGHLYLG